MLKNILLLTLIAFLFSCKGEKKSKENAILKSSDIAIEAIDFKGLETFLSKEDDKTYVVNFWATWCKPCIKELPYFQELEKAYTNDQLKVLLISLDFPEKLNEKLIPFVEKHKITSKVLLLDAPNENEWIPKVDSTWSGAIPATIIYNRNNRVFYEQSFSKEELLKEVEKFTKN